MRIDIYSDTVCPWCYLGKRRFELAIAARPQYEPRVTWRPFELNPDMPAAGIDSAEYLTARIGTPERVAEAHAELKRQGLASGIDFRFDMIERMPNTRRSHLLLAMPAVPDGNRRVMGRVMRAYFERAATSAISKSWCASEWKRAWRNGKPGRRWSCVRARTA